MFTDFDPSLLNDPEFKEDAVREVIITPILTRLGYSPSGTNRVIRSKNLVHPFIYAGTRKIAVTLIPDYTLTDGNKPLAVIDAKSPSVDILSRENVQQVYSYAIHPELKCQNFALCNGKYLAVFSVDSDKPLLLLEFSKFETEWGKIEHYLSPKFLKEPALRNFAPDFGSALARLGFAEGGKIVLLPAKFNLFARVDEKTISASANADFAERPHCISYDFDPKIFTHILSCLPQELSDAFAGAVNRWPYQAAAELALEADIETILGPEIELSSETFRPLLIEKIISARFDPRPLAEEPTDIPDGVFRLRKAYTLRTR